MLMCDFTTHNSRFRPLNLVRR